MAKAKLRRDQQADEIRRGTVGATGKLPKPSLSSEMTHAKKLKTTGQGS